MMIEGYRAISAAVENEYPLGELLYCSALFRSDQEDLLVRRMHNSGLPITETSREAFWKIADSGRPQGLMAIAPKDTNVMSGRFIECGGCGNGTAL
jgi:tRNA G18 (ribose-2'-O)-methylase SpoU